MAQYNTNVVLKELADCIGKYVESSSKQLSYTKGYKGTVKTNLGQKFYEIVINGITHKIKTDYPLLVGDVVVVLQLQNGSNDWCVIPDMTIIQRIINNT